MTLAARGRVVWLGMILAGLVLGAYVVAAWPDTSPRPAASSRTVRVTASVDTGAQTALAGMAEPFYPYPGEIFVYELGPTPMLDAVIAAPPLLDAG